MDENMTVNENTYETPQISEPAPLAEPVSENVIAGAVGAFLFSLIGGALFYLLYQVGYIAAISGIIGVVAAVKGYEVFSKKESIKGVVISVIIAMLVLVAAWYLCLATDIYNVFKDGYELGEIDFTLTFAEAVRGAYLYLNVNDPEPEMASIAWAYWKDLAIGLSFSLIGCIGSIRSAVSKAKAQKA